MLLYNVPEEFYQKDGSTAKLCNSEFIVPRLFEEILCVILE